MEKPEGEVSNHKPESQDTGVLPKSASDMVPTSHYAGDSEAPDKDGTTSTQWGAFPTTGRPILRLHLVTRAGVRIA